MNEKPKQIHLKYSMHALLQVLKKEGADEDNPIHKGIILSKVKEQLEKEGHLKEIDYSRNKTGGVRWITNLEFYFIDLQKGKFADRSRGQWWITEKGKELAEESPDGVYQKSRPTANKCNETQEKISEISKPSESLTNAAKSNLDTAQGDARIGIEERLKEIKPYEFQFLVADILTATGLTVEYVAPPGPDGGVDITATTNVLVQQPRLRVQVKHLINSETKVNAETVRALRGAIDQLTDAGILVTSSGFTKDAKQEAKRPPHIKLVDLKELLELLDKHYDKLPSRGKKLLPLKKVYFLDNE